MPQGDIDFVIAADVAIPVVRDRVTLEGREILIDPTSGSKRSSRRGAPDRRAKTRDENDDG
jgi:hypothetical protein